MDTNWSKLDNAAKIFPSSIAKFNTQVFRISCELNEEVDETILQQALDDTIKVFTVFRSVLKRGWFWYYYEDTDLSPKVRKEFKLPCAKIYESGYKGLLFEVTYFSRRINLEVFHALTDGTGAMHFLRMLVIKYVSKKYAVAEPEFDYDASRAQMGDDSFSKYYTKEKANKRKQKQKKGCAIKSPQYFEDRMRIVSGCMPVNQVLDAAHQNHATVTAFLSACFMTAIAEELPMRAKRRPVSLAVPVNLRRFFPSVSARNFFNLVSVQYNFYKKNPGLEEVCRAVDADLKRQLTKENLLNQLNQFSRIEHNIFIKPIPLMIKDKGLKLAYRVSGKDTTATISNVGIVSMPDEIVPFIRQFDVYNSTDKIQACVCSFENRLTVGFASAFVSTDIERRFFRKLTSLGIDVTIVSNFEDD